MKTTMISTAAISQATLLARAQLQLRLAEGQKESTTGRLADVGKTLGYATGRSVSLRQELDRLNTFKDTNSIATARLEITQTTLDDVAASAQDFLKTLIAARSTASGSGVAMADAKARLISLTSAMNTNVNGAQIFAGVNTDVKPVEDYYAATPPASRTAVANEFLTAFGLPQSAPGVENITGADMQTFLDGPFAAMFDPTNWATTWSQASDQNITTRISSNELIETSTNANTSSFRLLASAYTMVADFGVDKLNSDAYQAVIDKAIAVVGQAIGDLTTQRGALGTAQERISSANDRMALQAGVLTDHVNLLEGVDPYEATANVNALLTQIETAYALTARLQNLSLINYL